MEMKLTHTREKTLLVGLISIATLSIGFYLFSILVSKNGFVIPSSEIAGFPTELNEGADLIERMDWKVLREDTENNTVSTTWSNNADTTPGTPLIIRKVSKYSNGLEAKLAYESDINEIRSSFKWPNAYTPEVRFLKDSSEFGFLDDNFIVCEMGGPDSCQRWQYIGRYGKDLLEVLYIAPSRGISEQTFSLILEGIISDLKD